MSIRWLTENSSLRSRFRVRSAISLLLTVALVLASGCSLLPKEAEEEVLPPITPPRLSAKPEYEVRTTTLETRVRGSGRLMATKEETVYFTEDNKRIKEIYIAPGDAVSAGQLLAELDVSDLESQLRQRRLQQRSEELKMIQLLRENDGSRSVEEIEQAKIEFELKREEMLELEESIRNAKLTAPFSGTVVSVYVKRGDNVKAFDDVAVIADLNELTVAAELSRDDQRRVAIGMEVIVDINAAGSHKGKVKQLPNPRENSGSGQGGMPGQSQQDSIDNYMIVELDAFPEGLNRGTPLSVSVITQRKENAVVIPAVTLRTYAGRNYVQVVDAEGNKREVDVEIGQQTSTEIEILKGLEPGQKVVGK